MNPLAMESLRNVWTDYASDLKAVESSLHGLTLDANATIRDVTSHLFGSGGKRLRPMLLIISSRLSGYDGSNMILLSAAVEFIHTATLLHDDVVDHAEIRRGKPAANQVWGNQAAILVGDYLYATALYIATGIHDHEINDILTLACRQMSEGEILELMLDNNPQATEEEYLEVVARKTAALTAGTCRMGGILGGLDAAGRKSLEDYGYFAGMAFQVADDALDYMAKEERLGKTLGKDLSEGKMTLPLLHCLSAVSPSNRENIISCMGKGDLSPGDLKMVLSFMKETSSLEYALSRATGFMNQARAALDYFPNSSHRQNLLALSDFIIERDL